MSNNTYQTIAEEAWKTYTTAQSKYRGADYMNLLNPLYKTFFGALGGIDAVLTALGKGTQPSEDALTQASNLFEALQSTLANMGNAVSQFPAMDKKAINRAATLDQAALTKIYATVQEADVTMLEGLANALFGAQEAAARKTGAYAPDPQYATATKPKTQ